jgi:hypothetical protein
LILKNNHIIVILCCFIVINIFSFIGVGQREINELHDRFVFSEPIFIYHEDEDIISISLKNANSFVLKPGLPVIPSVVKTYVFPFGTKIKSVTCTPIRIEKIKLTKKVEVAPQPVMAAKIAKNKISVFNELRNDTVFPLKWFEYNVGCGIDGLERRIFLSLRFHPIKYLSRDNIVEYTEAMSVNIEYQLPRKSYFIKDYDFLIVCPSEFSDELQPLVEHKNNVMNVKTMLANLEDIPSVGRDKAEDLKYYIKDAIENFGIKFVLLVGDANRIPVRYVYVNDDVETCFVSDLYFADIYDENGNFSSWDTNDNNFFGEFNHNGNTDDLDLYPDVYIGRLSCVNEKEVTSVVDKIISYEVERAYTKDWFNRIILCGGDTAPGDENGVDEGEYANQAILKVMDGFEDVKIWASNKKLYYASNIDNAFNEGAGFVDFSGHGNPTVWATHPHNNEDLWIPTPGGYRRDDVSRLSNGEKLPIVVISACSCSKFDEEENCFGWSFISNENGGGIATLGNTGLGWIYTGKYVTYGLVGLMELNSFRAYSLDEAKSFGELWGNALQRYINSKGRNADAYDHKTIMEWQPLGDPTLTIASPSHKPNKPDKPDGPTKIKVGKTYSFTTSTTDPDGDKLYYWFDWGDGTNSGWLGPYNSGEIVTARHVWDSKGNYNIRVRAKDIHGGLSEWSDSLPISVPFSYPYLFLKNFIFYLHNTYSWR